MQTDQTFRTPEGFELHRPLLMPDARSFSDVLTAERAWDFATMNHKNGRPQAETPAEIRLSQTRFVSRFCSVSHEFRGYIPGAQHLQVSPTDALMSMLHSDDFAFFDRINFEAIYHPLNDRVLIVASASGIIASRYLAYVDPASVPTFEVA